jgi:Tol biopolymer transport system component
MRGINRVFGLSVALIFSIFSVIASTNNANAVAPGFAPGETTTVSLNNAGDVANSRPRSQGLSADGRYVVFASAATNLGAGDTPGVVHVYRRDLLNDTIEVVDVTPAGVASSTGAFGPSVSAHGNYVAFASTASDLVRGVIDTNGVSDVFVRNMDTKTTSLVSATARGAAASAGGTLSNATDAHVVSEDGTQVAFVSSSPDLGTDPMNRSAQVYVKNMTTGAVVLASAFEGVAGNGASSAPALTADGRWVAFASLSTNLTTPALGTASQQIYLRDLAGTTISLESVTWDGQVLLGGQMSMPSLSSDGLYLAFESSLQLDSRSDRDANTLDVYLRDRVEGTTVMVSHSESPTFFPVLDSSSPSVSADGQFVAFQSNDLFMVPGDANGTVGDVYLYDRTTTLLTIVSLNDDGVQAISSSTGPSLSGDGTLVLFGSAASNLAEPFASTAQLYLRNYAANAAPVLRAFGRDYPLFEGQPLRLTWEFSDDDASTSWSATVDYGDGAGAQRLALNDDKTFSLSHLYSPGAYVLTVEVTDDAGATGSLVIHVVVSNVAPTIRMASSIDLAFTRTLDTTGTFTDPGTGERYFGFVNFGDGTATEPLGLVRSDATLFTAGTFTLRHTYRLAGTYTVVVAISDSNGGSTRASMVVTVGGYSYEWLDPVGPYFGIGRNLPVKFTVRGPDGAFVLDRTVQVDVVNDSGTVVVGYVFGDQPIRSVTVSGDTYHVNVDTRDLPAGTYTLRVRFASSTLTGEFSLSASTSIAATGTTRTRISGLRD